MTTKDAQHYIDFCNQTTLDEFVEHIQVVGINGIFIEDGETVYYDNGHKIDRDEFYNKRGFREVPAVPMQFNLDEIMVDQLTFQESLGNNVSDKEFVKEMFLGMTCETSEALQECNWKNWKKDAPKDKKLFTEEMADIFLFYTNILLSQGITFTELLKMVKAKQSKNIQRQKDGY